MSAETSPAGEAGSSTDASDKEFSCPTCGDTFDSLNGRNVHHYQAHDESIAKTTSNCEWCGGNYQHYKHNDGRTYCSDSCRGKSVSEQLSGEKSPRWVGRVAISCEECGTEFEARKKENRKFCSRDCRYSHMEGKWTGENHPRWVDNSKIFECEFCGDAYEKHESLEGKTRFCSKECHEKSQSVEFSGPGNPYWKGGYGDYYGENWNRQRAKALERDGETCRGCGATKDENGRELSVHHVTPIRVYRDNYDDPEWWQKANQLDNLVTLCMDCHRKWEGIPLAPQ